MKLKYTNEHLTEIAKKYNNATEWKTNDIKSYNVASKRGLLAKITKHFVKIKRSKYTNKILFETALKYDSTYEWKTNDINSYAAAIRMNIYDEITKHFTPLRKKYTNNELLKIAQKYDNVTDWKINDIKSFNVACKTELMSEITKHFTPLRKKCNKYTNEQLSKIAQKYDNVTEWIKDDSKTYHAARRRNLLNEITKHFQRKPGGFNPELPAQFYQFKFKNQQVYNYGISNDYTKRYQKKDLDKMELLKIIEFKDGYKCKKYETEIQEQFQKYRYKGVQLLSNKKNTELLTVDIF